MDFRMNVEEIMMSEKEFRKTRKEFRMNVKEYRQDDWDIKQDNMRNKIRIIYKWKYNGRKQWERLFIQVIKQVEQVGFIY